MVPTSQAAAPPSRSTLIGADLPQAKKVCVYARRVALVMFDSCVRGQGWLGVASPHPRSRAAAQRSYPVPKARGGGWEEQPHVQGVVAAWAQEGLEELSHFEGQEGGSEEIPFIQGKE